MILEAKFDIAKSKITFLLALFSILLALFALLGVIFPIVFSQTQESRVKDAIANMEKSFKELSGKQLRKPKIICRGNRNELLQDSVFEIMEWSKTYINIHNQGDGLAGPVDAYLYFKDEKKLLENPFDNSQWNKEPCEDKNYSIKYFVGGCDHVSPQNIFAIPMPSEYFNFPSDSNTYQTSALLKVYYGEPEPIIIPFTIRIIQKN
jgi:hypothetical protein